MTTYGNQLFHAALQLLQIFQKYFRALSFCRNDCHRFLNPGKTVLCPLYDLSLFFIKPQLFPFFLFLIQRLKHLQIFFVFLIRCDKTRKLLIHMTL